MPLLETAPDPFLSIPTSLRLGGKTQVALEEHLNYSNDCRCLLSIVERSIILSKFFFLNLLG